jgi:SpoVK/Ycf46/Vps4 family AAA+-type ATPase
VDEAEKVIPKSRGGGGDSGVSSRMEGSFLTNMNDLTEQIFWVFTANDVANMHEAFFRAERIDMIFYVGLPSQEIRAAIWKQYGKKFFPEEVKLANEMVPFPGHRYVKFDDALAALRKAKKPKTEHWAGLFTLPLMCVTPDVRVTYRETLREEYPEIEGAIELVDDTDWSPAEIRACCRLSRKLNEVLTVTAQRIRPVSATAPKVIERLEEWATEAALDVETGTLYRPKRDEGAKTTDGRVIDHDEKRKRRKVKRHDDTY